MASQEQDNNGVIFDFLTLAELPNGSIRFSDQMGYLLTRNAWEAIKAGADRYYANITDAAIKSHNDKLDAKFFPAEKEAPQAKWSVAIPDDISAQQKVKKWVYLITSPAKSGYKIGCTEKRLYTRLKQVARELKSNVTCLHACHVNAPFLTESFLHLQFKQHNISGEWFDLNSQHLEIFPSLAREHDAEVRANG